MHERSTPPIVDQVVHLDDVDDNPECLANLFLDTGRSSAVVAFSCVHVTRRLEVQRGAFTLFGADPKFLETRKQESRLLSEIEIAGAAVDNLRRELELAGYTYASLFPDLDGISHDIVDREELRKRD